MAEQSRVALVTGGSRGIGAATVFQLAEAGWDVLLTYREDRSSAQGIVDRCAAVGRTAVPAQCDMADPASIEATYGVLDERFGRLDALVCNAGIAAPAKTVEQIDAARVSQMMTINVVAPFLLCARAVPRLRAAGGGSIVLVSSVAARLGSPGEYVDYAASKAAVDALTVGLAKEVAADSIRVNSVRPGPILTDIHATNGAPGRAERIGAAMPAGRAGEPEEVAVTITWLCDAAPDYLTASIIEIAGGR